MSHLFYQEFKLLLFVSGLFAAAYSQTGEKGKKFFIAHKQLKSIKLIRLINQTIILLRCVFLTN